MKQIKLIKLRSTACPVPVAAATKLNFAALKEHERTLHLEPPVFARICGSIRAFNVL